MIRELLAWAALAYMVLITVMVLAVMAISLLSDGPNSTLAIVCVLAAAWLTGTALYLDVPGSSRPTITSEDPE